MYRFGILFLVFLPLASALADEEAVTGPVSDLLITNVYLVGNEGDEKDVLVNVLILDGKLRIITESDIPPDRVRTTVDAQRGYVFGSLEVNGAPQLVILDRDPRADVLVLLDTAKHARFALKGGQIVFNTLPTTTEEEPQDFETRGWQAYAPPPIAVPLQYYDTRKWNRFDTQYASGLLTGALALDRLQWLSQDSESEDQVGDLGRSDGGEIRALRIGVIGRLKLPTPWVYTIFAATHTFDRGFGVVDNDDFTWFDYRLDIPLRDNLNLSIGKQKEPVSMERLMPLTYLPWQERAAVNDSLLQARNFGAVLNGTGKSQRWTWAASVFNNAIDSDTSWSETPTKFVGRVTWLPFLTADGSNLLHLGAAIRSTGDSDVRRYRAVPEFDRAPLFLDTDEIAVDGELTSSLEAYWRRGPYLLGVEYTRSDLDAPTIGDPTFSGYSVSGTWALSGEMRDYRNSSGIFGPAPVAQSVDSGGLGAWELAVRYATLDLADGGIDGGDMDVYSLGLNWWLTTSSQVSLNYRYINLHRFNESGGSSGLNFRLLLTLE